MQRITIQIDGEPSVAAPQVSGVAPHAEAAGELTAPAPTATGEVLAAQGLLGATNAGPAPTGPPTGGMPAPSTPVGGADIYASEVGDLEAGEAPGVELEAEPAVSEEQA
jgi:hypothetical protein